MSYREASAACGFRTTSQLSNTIANLKASPDAVELRTLRRIAEGLRVSFEWLVTGVEPAELGNALRARRTRDLAAWKLALVGARVLAPQMPEWVWEEIGNGYPLFDDLTPGALADLGQLVLRHKLPR